MIAAILRYVVGPLLLLWVLWKIVKAIGEVVSDLLFDLKWEITHKLGGSGRVDRPPVGRDCTPPPRRSYTPPPRQPYAPPPRRSYTPPSYRSYDPLDDDGDDLDSLRREEDRAGLLAQAEDLEMQADQAEAEADELRKQADAAQGSVNYYNYQAQSMRAQGDYGGAQHAEQMAAGYLDDVSMATRQAEAAEKKARAYRKEAGSKRRQAGR